MSDPGVPRTGTLVPVADPARPDFAELRRRVRQEGLMDRRPRYYAIKITVLTVLFAGGWVAFVALGDSWYQLLVAVYLAIVFTQIGFWLEGLLLFGHGAGYLAVVFLVLSWPHALVFIAVQQGLFGLYMGSVFAPNHKGMPVLSQQDSLDFLRQQVLTSRNVSGGRLTETALGGLNYQIEHHLFPAMPRPALRRCRTVVRAFCAQTGLLYCEKGLVSSYTDVLRCLHAAGR
jgi:fatty acid desaturase